MNAQAAKKGPGRPKGPRRRRVHVTLSEEAWGMVERIAGYLEQPKAAVLSEMFEEVLPAMLNTVEALHLAKQGQAREAQRIITNFGADAVMKLQQSQLEFDRVVTENERAGSRRGRKGATRRGRST